MRISLASFTALLFVGAMTVSASAQIAVYGTFSPSHIQGVATGNNISGGYSTSDFWTYGVGGGATLTLLPLGPVAVGLDVRGSSQPGTSGADTLLGGIRVAAKAPFISFRPYAEVAGGYLNTRAHVTTGIATGSSDRQGFAAYELLAGVDHGIAPRIDFRIVEVGVGRGVYVRGPNNNIPDVTFVTLSTGLVLRF